VQSISHMKSANARATAGTNYWKDEALALRRLCRTLLAEINGDRNRPDHQDQIKEAADKLQKHLGPATTTGDHDHA
jgi:hypothetical protein